MTPDQRRNLPPQAQKQYSERPITREDVLKVKDEFWEICELYKVPAGGRFMVISRKLDSIANAVDMLTRNLDAAEDTLALIAANGPVGVKMAVAKAQSEKPPPFPICEPVEWKQTATGERYDYLLTLDELDRAVLAGLGFDDSYNGYACVEIIGGVVGVTIVKGDPDV